MPGITGYTTPALAPGGANSAAGGVSNSAPGLDWSLQTPALAPGGATPGSLGSLLTAATGVYGSQNSAEDATQGINAGITTQQQTMGNINSLYAPQTTLGNSAMGALASAQGLNGQPADYSGFENMPGYQFAQTMGQQAGERQAAAMGNAGNSGTSALIANQVTGTAMQDYNTYISQLMGSAGLGAQANQQLAGANLETGTNISQLQQNSGQAQASGVSGASSAIGGVIGGLANSLTGGGNLGNIASGVSNYFNGNNAISAAQNNTGIDNSTGNAANYTPYTGSTLGDGSQSLDAYTGDSSNPP